MSIPGTNAAILTAVLLLAVNAWRVTNYQPEAFEPYARWRNGVIVHVRNCDEARTERARIRCAALYCTKKVTELMATPLQSDLKIQKYLRLDDGRFQVEGTIDQYLHAPTLPTGFRCDMAHYRAADPEMIYGRRVLPDDVQNKLKNKVGR
ncbi:MAG: hypothetical protein AAF384_04235 [Pseudomonadota bacterium]